MNLPLRILQITNRIPYPLNDGGNIATWYVAKYLRSYGHTVDLAFLNTNKHFENPNSITQGYNHSFSVNINTDIRLKDMLGNLFSSIPYNIARFESKEFEVLLIKILKENTYDVIQIEGAYMALYISVLRRHSTAKIVLRSHNIEHKIWQRLASNTANPVKKLATQYLASQIKKYEDKTLHLMDAIVAITPDDEAYYRDKNYRGIVRTIQAGFEDEPLIENAAQKNTVCFIGSMHWLPNNEGVEWFLNQIWPLVLKELPRAEFHIAGKGMDGRFDTWKRPSVFLHGLVPNAATFIQNHSVFVVPLRSGGGMRLKVVEAMGMRMPIVSTTIGAEGISYTADVDLLIGDTPEEIKNKIVSLLLDPEFAKRISYNARLKAMNDYSWANLIPKFEKLYNEL